jgi:hypothetical protein
VSRHQPFGGQAPDPAVAEHLVELILLDLLAEIGAAPGPRRLLDDAAVHVGDVHRPVGRRGHVDRAEQRIGRADELRQRIHVAHLRETLGLHGSQAAHDARDGFTVEVVADHVFRQAIAAEHVVAGAGCRSIQ